MTPHSPSAPLILAPAGSRIAFLAALAAGADAVYCGLKQFSARMEAKNFLPEELAELTELAHDKGAKVYVTLNTLVKPDEISEAGRLLDHLNSLVRPDAIIIQDLAWADLAEQAGFSGEIHLSTLANVSIGAALPLIHEYFPGISRIVLPRELSIDEIKQVASICPGTPGLEVFVHGALCYGVSGRCYWSSFLGGKSGLRGKCVQPCRRLYTRNRTSERLFSCQDFSLDVLVKVLLTLPAIQAWKIEGRKKGPHYVYHTVKAYRLLRDHVQDSHVRKEALHLLSFALGRSGTHYAFLSQRPQNPIPVDRPTGSGFCIGHVACNPGQTFIDLQEALIPGDVIRIGYEDEPWHATIKIDRSLSKGDRYDLSSGSNPAPIEKTPVFLTDRREPALLAEIAQLEAGIHRKEITRSSFSGFRTDIPRKRPDQVSARDHHVYRLFQNPGNRKEETGIWLSPENCLSAANPRNVWWWLPPVLWPKDEASVQSLIARLLKSGCRRFVLNAPWQIGFFQSPLKLILWAGPFCNVTNPLAIRQLKHLGFSGVIVSPELGDTDYLSLPSQSLLPLGVVLSGNWPLCISRILSGQMKPDTAFHSSRGEMAWVSQSDTNYWVYPNWILNLKAHRQALETVGYQWFIHLSEVVPQNVTMKNRPGNWNWKLSLS